MTRLTGKARMATSNRKSVNDIIVVVLTQCISKETTESLIGQTNVKLTMRLKNVYLKDGIPKQIAQKTVTKHGVISIVVQGISDRKTRIMLKTGSLQVFILQYKNYLSTT